VLICYCLVGILDCEPEADSGGFDCALDNSQRQILFEWDEVNV